MEDRSELRAQVDKTLEEFKTQANSGQLTREYKEAVDVIQICAGCCGLFHNKEDWQKCTIEDMNGNTVEGINFPQSGGTNLRCAVSRWTRIPATGN